jgi:hypothetical protein
MEEEGGCWGLEIRPLNLGSTEGANKREEKKLVVGLVG